MSRGKHLRCCNSQAVSTPLAVALGCTCTPCYVVSTAIRLTTSAINGPCVHGLTSRRFPLVHTTWHTYAIVFAPCVRVCTLFTIMDFSAVTGPNKVDQTLVKLAGRNERHHCDIKTDCPWQHVIKL